MVELVDLLGGPLGEVVEGVFEAVVDWLGNRKSDDDTPCRGNAVRPSFEDVN